MKKPDFMYNGSAMVLAGESNLGLVRRNNEDSFCLVAFPRRHTALAVVADGVGGHANGELASLITCRDVVRAYLAVSDSQLDPEGGGENFLRRALDAANTKIFRRNFLEQRELPMCTTVVALLFLPDRLILAWAGDSRCYEMTEWGDFRQLSCDHTLCEAYEQEFGKPFPGGEELRNVIARAIGPRSHSGLELRTLPRHAGSRYLLCSDGLSRYVNDEKIKAMLSEATVPREAVNRMMRAALLGGGRDNITAVVAFPAPAAKECGN